MEKIIEKIFENWEGNKIIDGAGYVREKFKTHKQINSCMCSSIFASVEGEITDSGNYACHAGLAMDLYKGNKLAYILSGTHHLYPRQPGIEVVHHMIDWLINHSPYRNAYVLKDMEIIKKLGILVLDPDQKQNYMVSALQATRAWTEHFNVSKLWYELVQAGIHPVIAYVLGYYIRIGEDKTLSVNRLSHCEWNSNKGDGALVSFLKETPDTNVISSFRASRSYYGSYKIWPDKPLNTEKEKLFLMNPEGKLENLKDRGVKTVNNNPFAKAKKINYENNIGVVKLVDFIAYIKDEYEPTILEVAKNG